MVVKWAIFAKQQLKNIFDYYLEVAGKKVAREIVNDIQQSTKLLASFPLMAAIEPALKEFSDTFHSLVVRHRFKVVYYIDEANNKIVIVTIFDCRQDPNKLKEEVKK
jgi:plasmid stabilization system protein ParE